MIKKIIKGEMPKATEWNELVEKVHKLESNNNNNFYVNKPFFGVLKDVGPNSEADYTDNKYWFTKVRDAKSTNVVDIPGFVEYVSTDNNYLYDTCTNIAELGTHDLTVDGTLNVLIYPIFDNSSPAMKDYIFTMGVGGGASVFNYQIISVSSTNIITCKKYVNGVVTGSNVSVHLNIKGTQDSRYVLPFLEATDIISAFTDSSYTPARLYCTTVFSYIGNLKSIQYISVDERTESVLVV